MPHLRLIILFRQSFYPQFSHTNPSCSSLCPSEDGPNCSCNNAYKPLHLSSHLLSTLKLMWIWNLCWLTGEMTTGNASTVSASASNLRWICNQATSSSPLVRTFFHFLQVCYRTSHHSLQHSSTSFTPSQQMTCSNQRNFIFQYNLPVFQLIFTNLSIPLPLPHFMAKFLMQYSKGRTITL